MYAIEKEKCPTYISKINSNRKKKEKINNSKRRKKRMALSWSKKISALLHGIASKHKGDFYSLNCHHSFRTKNKT